MYVCCCSAMHVVCLGYAANSWSTICRWIWCSQASISCVLMRGGQSLEIETETESRVWRGRPCGFFHKGWPQSCVRWSVIRHLACVCIYASAFAMFGSNEVFLLLNRNTCELATRTIGHWSCSRPRIPIGSIRPRHIQQSSAQPSPHHELPQTLCCAPLARYVCVYIYTALWFCFLFIYCQRHTMSCRRHCAVQAPFLNF